MVKPSKIKNLKNLISRRSSKRWKQSRRRRRTSRQGHFVPGIPYEVKSTLAGRHWGTWHRSVQHAAPIQCYDHACRLVDIACNTSSRPGRNERCRARYFCVTMADHAIAPHTPSRHVDQQFSGSASVDYSISKGVSQLAITPIYAERRTKVVLRLSHSFSCEGVSLLPDLNLECSTC